MKRHVDGRLNALWLVMLPVLLFSQGWFTQNSGTNKPLFDVHFADAQNGWIASITNSIFHTTDGGANWFDLEPTPSVNYYAIHFVSTQEGWAAGNFGQIRYTTDGGTTWVDQNSAVDGYLWDMYFIDEDHGWMAGGRVEGFPGPDPTRYILYTSNGGSSWNTQFYENDANPLHAIDFLDSNIGYAVGEAGAIFGTTNGGGNWIQQNSGTIREFTGVSAVTLDTAWAVGVSGLVVRTTNGGSTWDSLYLGTTHHFSHIQFIDALTGWIAGGDNDHATILHTTDGGATWVMQDAGTTNYLYGFFFLDADLGWAVGYDGTIIHTTTGGTGVEESGDLKEMNTDVILAQNSPNPFSGMTSIRFSIPQAAHVRLAIYDLIGQEVAELVDGHMPAGQHSIAFDGNDLPNGVYFYRLNTGSATRTKMCVLLR
ncbi:MAG: T9SS type A sorting domain-containing protein [candidate division WOR-3 bacterium]|nr:MAG: T9SS type A sorting domain-containing protein [candidate division WOR-3 bacterium]